MFILSLSLGESPQMNCFDPGHHWRNSRYCFYCRNCTKFVQLIFMIIVATRCQILRGSLQHSPDPLSGGEGLAATSPRTPPALSALWASNLYTKFVQLILTKIIMIVATRCQILRLKCTKFDFDWGSAPDSAGELTALPRSSIWWGEAGCAPHREPNPRSRPFGPRRLCPCLEVFHKY